MEVGSLDDLLLFQAPKKEESDIYVCHARSCMNAGSEAVLLEIEELAKAVDAKCKVKSSGCLGYCNRAPAVLVLKNRKDQWSGRRSEFQETPFTRVEELADSVMVIKFATGAEPPVDDPVLSERLLAARMARVYKQAMKIYRWNTALKSLMFQMQNKNAKTQKQASLEMKYFNLVSKLDFGPAQATVNAIENYSLWTLNKVTIATKHSAIFHFTSKDSKRSTPHPRGLGRRVHPNTWHTTMLAQVGANEEGPLPWIERDYTPISTGKEWEAGRCDILIKVYPDGKATQWLFQLSQTLLNDDDSKEAETQTQVVDASSKPKIWFSRPIKTLSTPWLVHQGSSFLARSVLLLLAGTGVVALPQILAHRDPYDKLGISVPRKHQFPVPIDVIVSYREDDVLMLPEMLKWCQEAVDYASQKNVDASKVIKGVRNCTVLLTDSKSGDPPFSRMESILGLESDVNKLMERLPNFRTESTRLNQELLSQAIDNMQEPFRVVISGPSSFNSAARTMLLDELEVPEQAMTVLSA